MSINYYRKFIIQQIFKSMDHHLFQLTLTLRFKEEKGLNKITIKSVNTKKKVSSNFDILTLYSMNKLIIFIQKNINDNLIRQSLKACGERDSTLKKGKIKEFQKNNKMFRTHKILPRQKIQLSLHYWLPKNKLLIIERNGDHKQLTYMTKSKF